MKKSAFAAVLFAGLMTFGAVRPAEASVAVSISFFHETLAPHGRWVVTGSYGQVWVPAVSPGWAPYVNGEWVYTDFGWSWVSYDPWGDIPFHYGTWVWSDLHGWVWVPGLVWAPAWVTWAYTSDYIGWAPVPPSFVLTASGYFGRPIVVRETRYVFVPARQFVGVQVSSVRLPPRQNSVILARANKVTTYRVSSGIVRNVGPAPERIERVAGRSIERVSPSRAKLRPVTLAQSGVAKTSRLSVVAPKRERERALRGAGTKAPAGRTQKAVERGSKKERAAAVKPARSGRQEAAAPQHRPVREKKAVKPKEKASAGAERSVERGRAETSTVKRPARASSPERVAKPQRASTSQRVKQAEPQKRKAAAESASRRAAAKPKMEKASRPSRERQLSARAPQAPAQAKPVKKKGKPTRPQKPDGKQEGSQP